MTPKTYAITSLFYLLTFTILLSACSTQEKLATINKQVRSSESKLLLNTKMRQMQIALGNNSNAIIFYEKPEWQGYAHQITHVIQSALERCQKYLDLRPGLYLEIILLNQNTFTDFISSRTWVKAAFHKGRVFIPVDANKVFSLTKLKNTITHELAHAVIADLTQGNAPGWFDEGLALLIESKDTYAADKRYIDWLKYNKPLPLDKLQTGFTHLDDEHASYAYVQSKLLVKQLYDKYSHDKINNLLNLLGQNIPIEQAFIDTFEIELQHFAKISLTDTKNFVNTFRPETAF